MVRTKDMVAADSRSQKRSLYRNTIIFAIVAAIITVAMLGVAVFVPNVTYFRVMFLTIEIGLLAIIIHALIKIRRHENKIQALMKNAANNVLESNTCPNFYTSHRTNDGSVICRNEYTSPRHGTMFEFASRRNRPVPDEVMLSDIDGKPVKEMCKIVDPSDEGKHNYNVPWTELRTKCDTIMNSM